VILLWIATVVALALLVVWLGVCLYRLQQEYARVAPLVGHVWSGTLLTPAQLSSGHVSGIIRDGVLVALCEPGVLDEMVQALDVRKEP
jgi:hypothetical protein